jgi:uncharacterized protein involved in exopolysaccharide biosynthesis
MDDNQEIHSVGSVDSFTEGEGIYIRGIVAHLKTVWESRRKIISITLLFMFIGIFIAIFTPKKYTASTVFVPQTSDVSKVGGSLGGLAALAGVNLGGMNNGESEISPTLYPQILSSFPFQKELLKTPLTIEGIKEKVTYEKYYLEIHKPGVLTTIKKYTIGLPELILSSFKQKKETTSSNDSTNSESQVFTITSEEKELIENLLSEISLNVNKKDGYISISSTMTEPKAAAELVLKTQELLQKYIIDFKVNKSKDKLNFIQERYLEKEKEFKDIQSKLTSYQDRNQFSNSSRAKKRLTQYQTEYDLVFDVYSELAKQFEAQQIQVKEDTPVFTILKPVVIPIEKSGPKRLIIIISWTFLGLILGVGMIYGNLFLNSIKNSWNKQKN